MKRGLPLDPRTSVLRIAAGVDLLRTPEEMVHLVGAPIQPWGPLRALAWLMRVPRRGEVELDAIGTWVMDRIHECRLDELAVALAQHLKLSPREAQTALADFVSMLLRRQLVVLLPEADAAAYDAAQATAKAQREAEARDTEEAAAQSPFDDSHSDPSDLKPQMTAS